MPFCQNCGRPLAEGEVCQCRNMQGAPQNSPYMKNPGQPYQNTPYPGQPNPQYPGQQQYQYQYQQGQPQKKTPKALIGCLIAFGICAVMLPILGVLAAILVPAMIGYNTKAHTSQANTAAKMCYNAAMTALVDMDAEGQDISGTYIITNDPGLNPPAAPYDTQELYSLIQKHYGGEEDCTYFAVVENGTVTYLAAYLDKNPDYIGTYPKFSQVREITDYNGETRPVDSLPNGESAFTYLYKVAAEGVLPFLQDGAPAEIV